MQMLRTPIDKTESPPKEASGSFAGAPIMWSTKKQTVVASSTTGSTSQRRQVACQGSFTAWPPEIPGPHYHFTGNINTQLLLAKKGSKNSTRWLEIRYFFVKNAVARGHIDVKRADTKCSPADGFTKALEHIAFKRYN
jgi:hypothetical protein